MLAWLWIRLIGLISADSCACAESPICQAVADYLIRNDRIAFSHDAAPNERAALYRQSLVTLIVDARRIYGPFCPCTELMERAVAHQQHMERYRSPPPGWGPGDADFLPTELAIAAEEFRLFRRLTAVCHDPLWWCEDCARR